MTARTQDIRFSCRQCGQRIVVDASAAGVETACPACKGPVVIPQIEMLTDRETITASAGRGNGSGRTGPADGAARVEALERELAASAKEVARLQERLRAIGEERSQLKTSLDEATKRNQQAADDLDLARERIKALEIDDAASRTRRAEAEQELSEAKAEIVRLQDESNLHRRNFDDAHARLGVAEAAAQRASSLGKALQDAQEKLAASIAEGRRSEQRCAELGVALESARRELQQTESGRELTALRARFAATEEELKRLTAQFSDVQGERDRFARSDREWHQQFDAMRRERDEALSRADASSHSALQHGNDVLRGILDRQKNELDERYAELRRLRSAHLSLRILYAIGAILLFVAIVLGLQMAHGMWR